MNAYPGLYNYPHNPYGNAVVLIDMIDPEWMEANLVATQEKWNEDCNGQRYYAGKIIGYSTSVTRDGFRFYSFFDPENKVRVIQGLHDMVIDTNPVLADQPSPRSPAPGQSPDLWFWVIIALLIGGLIGTLF